jgi:GTPase SAR1 family protein
VCRFRQSVSTQVRFLKPATTMESASTTTASPLGETPSGQLPPIVQRLERGEKTPICVIMVGMAGSGKTTLLTQLQRSLETPSVPPTPDDFGKDVHGDTSRAPDSDVEPHSDLKVAAHVPVAPDTAADAKMASYVVNLDPATLSVPYEVSIDIRDTVDYKQVMQQHKLGPNGAIMTSLNLFATKFDQVMTLLEKRAYEDASEHDQEQDGTTSTPPEPLPPQSQIGMDYILVDTPGQIEAFTWSASGAIMSEALASAFPTVLCFVVDTVRCASSPNTFMSNMLYACSMMYRTRLPLIVCFNKTDVVSHEFCLEWMRDHDAFQEALDDVSEAAGFYGSLTRSLALVLDEFYSSFANAVGVSAVTGDGMDDFWKTVEKAGRQDFVLDYIEDLKNRIEEQQARTQAMARVSLSRLQRDVDAAD